MNLTDEQNRLLERHMELVASFNERFNLTTIDGDNARILHVEDSLAGVSVVNMAPDGLLADLGSGAGFPGIPLSITTGRKVTLVESVKKKAHALTQMAQALESKNIEVYVGRAEELALEKPEQYAVVTARALTQLPSLLELAAPLLIVGGWLIAYKASDIALEFENACAICDKLGMEYRETVETTLSDGTPRSFVVFWKKGQPSVVLPRRPGMAQKHPYRP